MLSHQPVLLSEVLTGLISDENGIYIDATYGRGGHSQGLLARLRKQAHLFAFDRDPAAIEQIPAKLAEDKRFKLVHSQFSRLQDYCEEWEISGKVCGILFDLGVSSPQLETAERGFSFNKEGFLDMRMDTTQGQTAQAWLANVKERELSQVLWEFGEERFATRIARAIITARAKQPIETTLQLAEIVKLAKPKWETRIHPATKSFQAIRIFINNELQELQQALQQAYHVLKKRGRLAVISFHSLEDRIVKRFFRGFSVDNKGNRTPHFNMIARLIKASDAEIKQNPRARSAVLRIAEKII